MNSPHKKKLNRKRIQEKFSTHIYVLPNLVTTGNLFFGYYSIIHAFQGKFITAAFAIVAASIFDLLDGRVARLTRTTSKFGAEYDSLCDLVSFGIAPSLLLYLWALQPFGRLGWMISFLYVACSALRLARFNVSEDEEAKGYFQGLPVPMAAGIVASSVLAFQNLKLDAYGSIALLAMTALLSFVMVSNFRYRSFKDVDLRQRLPFRYLVIGISIFSIVAYWPEVMLFTLFLTYAVLGALFGFLRLGKKPKFLMRKTAHDILEEELLAAQEAEEEEEDDDEQGVLT